MSTCEREYEEDVIHYHKRGGINIFTSYSRLGNKNMVFKKGGVSPNKGKKASPELRKRMSDAQKGKKMPEETKIKISLSMRGRRFTDDHKQKIGEANRGRIWTPESKQKISEVRKGQKMSEVTKLKISEKLKGRVGTNLGKTCSEETRKKISVASTGRKHSEESKLKMSESGKGKKRSEETCRRLGLAKVGHKYNLGHHHTPETKAKISIIHKGKKLTDEHKQKLRDIFSGDKNPSWKGGVSFEPYCIKFTQEFKERVRAYFGYCCVECGKSQGGRKLHIHHVNFDKQTCCNDTIPLFVSLCLSCHAKTNGNRVFWQYWFTETIARLYGGKCYLPK